MRDVTPGRSLLTRIFAATTRVGDVLHARADRRAEAYGWEVRRSRSGLTRTYRDARWRYAKACPRCGGEGEGCRRCQGTGRLVHRPGRAAS